jgi:hypothetical protein
MRFIPKGTYSKVNSRKVSIISLKLGPKDYFLKRHKYSLFLKELSII